MSRKSIALILLTFAVAMALAVFFLQPGSTAVSTKHFDSGSSTESSSESLPSFTSSNDLVLERLAEIDARLSGIEHQLPVTQGATLHTSQRPIPINPHATAMAQRKLASMFPDHRIDRDRMLGYQIELSKLPAEEQLALSLAMAQAINAGRITFEPDR